MDILLSLAGEVFVGGIVAIVSGLIWLLGVILALCVTGITIYGLIRFVINMIK